LDPSALRSQTVLGCGARLKPLWLHGNSKIGRAVKGDKGLIVHLFNPLLRNISLEEHPLKKLNYSSKDD
jgi:hypothetical protein